MKKDKWFRETVVGNEKGLIRYTQKIVRVLEPSKEIVQESFLRLWAQAFPNQSEHYPVAWLYRVCRNQAIDYIRRERGITGIENIEELLESPCLQEAIVEASKVLQKIKTLSKSEQEVLVLKFCEDLNYKEISEITGLTVSNVGVKIHTGVKQVRDVLENELTKITGGKKNERKSG